MAIKTKLNVVVEKLNDALLEARKVGMEKTCYSIDAAIFNAKWESTEIINPQKKNLCQARIYKGTLQCSKRSNIDSPYCGTHAKIHA